MLKLVLLSLLGVCLARRPICNYYDMNPESPFHWKEQQNICTQDFCHKYAGEKYGVDPFECNMTRQELDQKINWHGGDEDIVTEMEIMKKYFRTQWPKWKNLDYNCTGECEAQEVPITKMFHYIDNYDFITGAHLPRTKHLCHVLGPEICYRSCGGRCKTPGKNHWCIPDLFADVQVWAYCVGAEPGCRRIRVKVPVSCSCKRVGCKRSPRLKMFSSMNPDISGLVNEFGKPHPLLGLMNNPTMLGPASVHG